MTHSLHRQGSEESLKNDFVMYARCSRGINLEGAEPKVRRIVDIVFDEGPNNAGDSPHRATIADGSLTREKALEYQKDTRGFISCFADREKMKRVLERIRDEDLGISIVVSGLIDEVFGMAAELGLKPHTVNLSLGIWGKQELLPDSDALELSTMCGHGLVSANLVKQAISAVKAGTMTPEEGARMIGRPCICGIVNLARAEELLRASRVQDNQ